nr:hypothetical protein B0A51_06855 [Rachicladosporium sp. CCFEE 5018]
MANPPPNWQSLSNSSQWITQAQPVARLPEDEDNFERHWSWNSGNAQGTVHESRQSWTTPSQASTPQVITTFSAPPMPMTPAIAMPVMRPTLPTMPSMHDFHQQSQQMMNNIHQNALDSHSRMVEDMNRNMSMGAMSMQSSYPQPQQQIAYHSSSTSLAPVQQQIAYRSSSYSLPPLQQQPAQIHYTQNVFHRVPPQSQPQQLQVSSQQRIAGPDERFQAIKETRANDMRNINEQGAAMKTAMRGLEQQVEDLTAQKRQDDSSQRQIRDLQDQIAGSARRQLVDARRHDAEMEELRRNQRSAPQPQAPALDMDALRKVILETQAKQISAADVQRAVEEAVAQRLVGVARREDLEAASSSMQKALGKVPQGASEEQVQNAFGKEVNKIVERVERHQRREVEAAPPPQQQPWARPQPEFTIEEIDDDEPAAVPAQAYQPANVPVQRHQPSYQPAQPRVSAPTQVQYVPQPVTIARTRAPVSTQPRLQGAPGPQANQTTIPIQAPELSNTVSRTKKPPQPSPAPAAPAAPNAVSRNVSAPQAPGITSAPIGDSTSTRQPVPATSQMQLMVHQAAPVVSSAPQSGSVARSKKPRDAAPPPTHSAAPMSVPYPTQPASVPITNTAPQSGAITRVKKPNNAAPVAPPLASTAVAKSGTATAAPVPQAAQVSGTLARVKKPSQPAPGPVPQHAHSTAMIRPGSRTTAAAPATTQHTQQMAGAPSVQPPRQLMPPPASAAAPSGAMVRHSKDVARKPR